MSFESKTGPGERIALVIGNSDYAYTTKLANPGNDALSMSDTLRGAGFSVTQLIDADQSTMKRALLEFGRSLRRENVDAGLFFYAGHGVQVNGENYLVPVNARILDEDEIDLEAVNVNDFLQVMNSSNADINIVILDACRNNPFAGSSRSAARGLAPVDAPKGTLIAYATAPGDVALDGSGRNSPYTSALTKAIASGRGRTIESVFKSARREVLAATGDRQTPWETSSIVGDFFFHSEPADTAMSSGSVQPEPVGDAIAQKFSLAEKINSRAAWTAFLNEYQDTPDNFYVALARSALAELDEKQDQTIRHLPLPDTPIQECYTEFFGAIPGTLCVSSVLGDQSGNTYRGNNLADRNMSTAWVEGGGGDGIGEVLRFAFDQPTLVNQIVIANGYNKNQGVYSKNNRVKSFNVQTSTGFSSEIQVADKGGYQVLDLPQLGEIAWVTLTLTGVHRGTKYRDTAISELQLQ